MTRTLSQEINELLDTTTLLCEEIADQLECDVEYVNKIVHQRWLARVGESL